MLVGRQDVNSLNFPGFKMWMISATFHRAGRKTKARDCFHQRFNIVSACFEVKTTMYTPR
jgi:hypothetical protein